ncbi:MAG: VOC family protein [Desulfobacteraceae bacterium]|nr:VOC family protein [Desulfobacteraceae bacterium]
MEHRISIITLGVADLERSVRFYRDGLGFPTNYRAGESVAFFATDGVRLALYPLDKLAEDISPSLQPEKNRFGGITLAHNTRTREEVAAVLQTAEGAGGTIVKPAQDVFWGGHSGYFSDPDGYFWEVAWGPMFRFAPDGSLLIDPEQ